MIWLAWALLLIAQNFAFTFTSRARNSASLKRHVFAALMSNAIWFAGQTVLFTKMFDIVTGKYGVGQALLVGVFYTVFTIFGSVLAHYISLRTEKGAGKVGASKTSADISNDDWALAKYTLHELWGRTFLRGLPTMEEVAIRRAFEEDKRNAGK